VPSHSPGMDEKRTSCGREENWIWKRYCEASFTFSSACTSKVQWMGGVDSGGPDPTTYICRTVPSRSCLGGSRFYVQLFFPFQVISWPPRYLLH
jgi:hypothetical protein